MYISVDIEKLMRYNMLALDVYANLVGICYTKTELKDGK
jgi:hypothetical protein